MNEDTIPITASPTRVPMMPPTTVPTLTPPEGAAEAEAEWVTERVPIVRDE